MAKRINESENGASRGKIRFIIADVEGNDQTLQDLVRTMAPMLSRPVQVQIPPKRIAATQDAPQATGTQPEPTLFNAESDDQDVMEETVNDAAPESTSAGARRKRGDGPKVDRNAGITPVSDLDFVPDGKQALKTFFGEKSPATDMEQILVLGYYIQHTIGIAGFGPGHILSAFKHVGKPVPVDLKQTMRNIKRDKVWITFSDIDSSRLTTEGENEVEHALPRSSAKATGGSK